jgi:hypothetical protein
MRVIDFFALNFRDAERRLGRLTAPITDDPSGIWRIVDESAIGRMLAWIVRQCDRAQTSSLAVAGWGRAVSSWKSYGPSERMRMIGVVVLVAAGVHIALAASAQPVGGWWLILPGIAAMFGAVALALSWSSSES